jgi:hypothetical protein
MTDSSQGPTLVLARSRDPHKSIFGGFASASWPSPELSRDVIRRDPKAFVFTLTNSEKIPPTIYNLRYGNIATFSDVRIKFSVDELGNFGLILNVGGTFRFDLDYLKEPDDAGSFDDALNRAEYQKIEVYSMI